MQPMPRLNQGFRALPISAFPQCSSSAPRPKNLEEPHVSPRIRPLSGGSALAGARRARMPTQHTMRSTLLPGSEDVNIFEICSGT